MLKKAAIFASGNGSNFQVIIDACKSNDIELDVRLLVCNREDAYVIHRAKKNDVDVLLIDYSSKNTLEIEKMLIDKLGDLDVEYIFLAGYLKKLSSMFIDKFKNKIINIHPSLLPKYKGLNAIEQAIESNESEIGVTVHYVDEEIDNGKIIMQDKISIIGLSKVQIYEKVHILEHRLYIEAIKKLEDD